MTQRLQGVPSAPPPGELALEWPYWDEGETIWPCPDCRCWHLELFEPEGAEGVWVREWHAADCPVWERMSAETS